jgi:stress-induced morphogen
MDAAVIEQKKTDESRLVESELGRQFAQVECYRYNDYSLRLRIIDEQFRGLSQVQRGELVDPWLHKLPESIQEDLVFVLLLSPDETTQPRYATQNLEFTDPSPFRI